MISHKSIFHSRSCRFLFLLCLLVFSQKLHCQEIPQLDTLTLKTGLKIYLLQYGEDSVLNLKLVMNGGKKNETECQVGYSEIIQQLLNESLKEKQQQGFKKANRVSCKTANGQTALYGKCSKQDLGREIELFSTVVSMLSFKREQMDRVVSFMCEKYKAENMSPADLAVVYRDLLLYGPKHHLGRTYCQYQVQKVLPEQLREFYIGHYTPGRSSLVICGNFKPGEVKKMIAKHFIKWRPLFKERPLTEEVEHVLPEIKNRDMAFVNKREAEQCLLKWTQAAPSAASPDHLAYWIACQLFDRYLDARLKEVEGSNADSLKFKPVVFGNGFVDVNCVTGYRGIHRAIQLFDTTLQSFRHLSLTETDLVEIINKLKEEYVKISTAAGILSFYDPLAYRFEWRRNYLNYLSAITFQDIQRVVEKYFKPGAYQLIMVGKEQQASGQLALLSKVNSYEASGFETCDEACREIVVLKCHCESCYRRGQCYLWRFDPSQKEAIRNARSRAKASLK